MARLQHYRPTKAVVNLEAIRQNIRSLRSYIHDGTVIISVVKADGYGHGIVEVANASLEAGAEMVSVATPDEALYLRDHGVTCDILVMAPSPVAFAAIAAEQNITVTISDVTWLKEVASGNTLWERPLKVHIKIDSGMGRVGVTEEYQLEEMIRFLDEEQGQCFQLDGTFTHFSCADDGVSETTQSQCERFQRFVQLFPKKPRLVHASNSAATLLYPEYGFDAVRFGISLYGIAPSPVVKERLPFALESALSIETSLSFVKKVSKGQTISYGATYESEEEEWIGTIPIGYADGLKRALRGQEVLIDGKRMPIVGTICMDQCMVKLPKQYPVGEPVVLIGKQQDEEVTMDEWAERIDTIPYEIAVSISKRVPRVYR